MKFIALIIPLLASYSTPTKHIPRKNISVNKDKLIEAIIYVESRGNDSAIGDRGKAVGCLQIHPIMVREVNRILNKNVYTLEDRYSRVKSIEMFNVIKKHTKKPTDEKLARNWNGGANGYKKRATVKYWHKVKKRI